MEPTTNPTTDQTLTFKPTTDPTTVSTVASIYDFIVGTDTMTWGQAEDWCLNKHGRHLVSILNDSQNEAASALCDDCWIGATCKNSSHGEFRWSDGRSWTYTAAWNSGEPNDHGNDEDCVHQNTDGSWNDVRCDATYRPLCGNEGILRNDSNFHMIFLSIFFQSDFDQFCCEFD